MPSGKTHDTITYFSAPIVGLGTYAVTRDVNSTLIVTGFFTFAGLMFSGDLDLKSRQYNRWSFIKFIWIPYQKMFSHRSIWTHGIGIGSIVRIAYLLLWVTLLGGFLSLITGFSFNVFDYYKPAVDWLQNNTYLVIPAFIGLLLGEISHTGADVIVSWYKRKKRKLRPNSGRSISRKRKVQRRIR